MSSTASQASGIPNANLIGADDFCISAANHFAAMSAGVSAVSYTGVSLDFWYLSGGSNEAYGEVYYSADGGSAWTSVGAAKYINQTSWAEESIMNAAFDNQADLRFGYRLVNGITSNSVDPAFSIDKMTINAVPEPSSALLAGLAVVGFLRRRAVAR